MFNVVDMSAYVGAGFHNLLVVAVKERHPKEVLKTAMALLGTGQALDVARRGDADVVFVHARSAEEKFVAEGQGVKRYPVMYNDFVLIGPKSDPATIAGAKTAPITSTPTMTTTPTASQRTNCSTRSLVKRTSSGQSSNTPRPRRPRSAGA